MSRSVDLIFPILFAIGIYLVLPVIMILGWTRWAKSKTAPTWSSILSLIGFTFATSSGVLAISSVMYAHRIGGFPYYDPLLLKVFRWGGLFSLVGLAFAIGGSRQANPLRWFAPACAAGMLLFWLMSAAGE